MIYCNLKGGLGNMMFQISAMNNFSHKSGIRCAFPNYSSHLSKLKNDKIHNQNCKHAHEYSNFIKNINDKIEEEPKYQVTFPFHYVDFNDVKDGMLFDGFFQSEKYFVDIKKQVQDLFNTDNVDLSTYEIDFNRSCSIHIRRGDYLKFSDSHPVMAKEYYINAVNVIHEKIDHILVFSDDIEWCKSNFSKNEFNKNIIYSKEDKDYLEISLMSKCAHNVIANSSFSWWGAWLNKNPNKAVIAPKRWFGKNLEHLTTADLLPPDWIKI